MPAGGLQKCQSCPHSLTFMVVWTCDFTTPITADYDMDMLLHLNISTKQDHLAMDHYKLDLTSSFNSCGSQVVLVAYSNQRVGGWEETRNGNGRASIRIVAAPCVGFPQESVRIFAFVFYPQRRGARRRGDISLPSPSSNC
ncbi:hypothetical protein TNCV_3324461 [Trichonephila clavipes]|nr:hypothetical protein TNCV_3324461 [Trichonephila clavipes]